MERVVFSGWIAGVGTADGHRLVVGHWPASPFGPVTDVMAEAPQGRRTLYAPSAELAAFVAGAYAFDEVRVVGVRAWADGRRWQVEAGPLRLELSLGGRGLLGWLLRAVPAPLARSAWWVGLLDLPARVLVPGVRTRGWTRGHRAAWYAPRDLRRIVGLRATLDGRDLGGLREVSPPVRFGFSSVPRRPALVQVSTLIALPAGDKRAQREGHLVD